MGEGKAQHQQQRRKQQLKDQQQQQLFQQDWQKQEQQKTELPQLDLDMETEKILPPQPASLKRERNPEEKKVTKKKKISSRSRAEISLEKICPNLSLL